jgi:uncharacterized protein (DUF1501 family)
MLALGRRSLLRAGLGALAVPALRGLAFGATAEPPGLLVLVFLRGGMDGLHFLSPADDRHFVDLRTADLRVAAEGGRAGVRLDAVPHTDFRLHPEAAPLGRIWQEGRMAIWPAAGVPEPTRSHFEAQALMGWGRGRRREGMASRGWLGGWAESLAVPDLPGPRGFAPQTALPRELSGMAHALAAGGLGNGLSPPEGRFGEAMLAALHDGAAGAAAAAGRAALADMRALDRLLPRDGDRAQAYAPAAGVDYAPGREFGRALSVVAQVAKLHPGLAAAALDLGGWDTHEGQAGRFADRMRVLAGGLDAFDRDMAGQPRRWTVLVLSEFGRRLRANRSGGTDHGRAGTMFAFGQGFGLGRQFGEWPGLAPEALEDGADLRVATDYREAVRRVLANLAPGQRPVL